MALNVLEYGIIIPIVTFHYDSFSHFGIDTLE